MAQEIDQRTSRVKRLRDATHAAHQRLDTFITTADPFASRANYVRFVSMQYRFHRDLDPLFSDERLDALLPDLFGRRRLALIEQDLDDLGVAAPRIELPPRFESAAEVTLPEALGWLYVVEGSNLGAAFLLKDAARLGFDATFGARHLAGAPEGRGLHWKTFTVALDAIELSDSHEQVVIKAASEAFATAEAHARVQFS
jgi:heme oxygenase (biliverdin-IX-beta and delta-forming)